MKTSHCLIFLSILFSSFSCEKGKPRETVEILPPVVEELKKAEIPLLSLSKGDTWKYKIRIEIPAGITSEGAAAVDVGQEKTRVFLGKIKVADKPEVDAFEVTRSGAPVERELIEIHDDRIMMRGSILPDEPNAKPVWLDPPVLFAFSGMRPGQEAAKFTVQKGERQRGIQVVARESVTVPAGKYDAVRLLMTGNDGGLILRKTIWFTPKVGIIKEEKSHYANEKLVYRETTELTDLTIAGR